jgi:hypothetical protein
MQKETAEDLAGQGELDGIRQHHHCSIIRVSRIPKVDWTSDRRLSINLKTPLGSHVERNLPR